ncbi:MAG: hypothetical protein C0498_02920 [Anaerolinea sp.]|jgi:TorA maturation chaperone TorD|nr:hypothetical protein [Anaerolinea sp.]
MTLSTPTHDRTLLYAVLSRLVSYPVTTDLLRQVVELDVSGPAGRDAAGELRRMQDAISALGGADAAIEVLNREATRLFEGPGQPLAPPFGSFYLSGGTLMGPEAAAVRGAYLDAGFLPDPSVHLPPDHLSLELGFLGVLAGRAGDGPDAQMESARQAWWGFIAVHLAPWLSLWQADLSRAEAHAFYLGAAGFISEILEADLAWLDEHRPNDGKAAERG